MAAQQRPKSILPNRAASESAWRYCVTADACSNSINFIRHRYIRYDNHQRIKIKLKGLSPVKYRTQALILSFPTVQSRELITAVPLLPAEAA